MGGGSWTTKAFRNYSTTSKCCAINADGSLDIKGRDASQLYIQRGLAEELNPYKVIRECRDSDEHPNTIPVILALDVTGSMGETAVEVAAELGKIMEAVFKDKADIEFMIMGIGDFAYDHCPLQVSQFESDIRIAEQLDKLYFEFGGGGNKSESYTAAWKFGLNNTDLDCWKRGKRGLIITIGDENINPYIPHLAWKEKVGESVQTDIETEFLLKEAKEKFNLYHIHVAHRKNDWVDIKEWKAYLGENNVISCQINQVAQAIVDIIEQHTNSVPTFINTDAGAAASSFDGISW